MQSKQETLCLSFHLNVKTTVNNGIPGKKAMGNQELICFLWKQDDYIMMAIIVAITEIL